MIRLRNDKETQLDSAYALIQNSAAHIGRPNFFCDFCDFFLFLFGESKNPPYLCGVKIIKHLTTMKTNKGIHVTRNGRAIRKSSSTTYENFYESTVGIFTKIASRPQREPDYISYKCGSFSKKISSEYWYGEDSRGKYVVRGSDHWSSYYKNEIPVEYNKLRDTERWGGRKYHPIASVYWGIYSPRIDEKKEFKRNYDCSYNRFRDSNGRLYAKIYLKNLHKVETR